MSHPEEARIIEFPIDYASTSGANRILSRVPGGDSPNHVEKMVL